MITIIVAKAENNVIGNNNQLIWHLPNDLKRFKKITSNHPIIMGRNTYESIGKPLPNRTNIVISNSLNSEDYPKLKIVSSLKEAIDFALSVNENIFIIGGGKVYEEALNLSNSLEITEVHHLFDGDTFFPEIDLNIWQEIHREFHSKDEKHKYNYSFVTYKKKSNSAELTK